MKKRNKKKNRGRSVPAYWARNESEICSGLSSSNTFDEMAGEGMPSGLQKTGDRWRCPDCGATYRVETDSDPHHFMSAKTTVTRIK